MSSSVDRRVAVAMIVVGSLTALVKLVAVVQNAIVAARLGTGPAVDAFVLAYRLPGLLENIVALSFAIALVPAWIQVREKRGEDAGARLLGQASTLLIAALAASTVLLGFAIAVILPVMGRRFDSIRLDMAQSASLVLLGFLLPIGLYHAWTGVLNARERFAAAALAPVLTPACVIASVLLLPPSRGAEALALGTVAGACLQAGAIALLLAGKGHGLRPRAPDFTDPAVRDVISRLGPLFLAHGLYGLTLVIDHVMATSLGPGSNAVLDYGLRVPAALAGLGTVAVGSAVLPYFSIMAARADWAALRSSLDRWVLYLLVLTAPVVIALVIFARPLTRLLLERGAFDSDDTAHVAKVLALGAVQVTPLVVNILLMRVLTAIGGQRTLLLIASFLVVLNVIGNWLLMRPLGVAGIALSTTSVYVASCAATWWAIRARARAGAGVRA